MLIFLLPNITDLQRGRIAELTFNAEVPLVVNGRSQIHIKSVNIHSLETQWTVRFRQGERATRWKTREALIQRTARNVCGGRVGNVVGRFKRRVLCE